MIKRTLYFGNPVYLSLSMAQLKIRFPEFRQTIDSDISYAKDVGASVPIEDIGVVVLDHQQITITQALLDALMNNNVAVISCDATHMPVGMMMVLNGNTVQNERFRDQVVASEPLKKQLWMQTVVAKVKNQSALLRKLKKQSDRLNIVYKNIKSGDSENGEATAAAYYWPNLFSEFGNFTRDRFGLPPNNYLNYGYALLRATMARCIVGAGLLPTLGIHHSNRYNAYCLADDLMEPYRPYVDEVVYKLIDEYGTDEDISKDIKAILLQIPAMDVNINGQASPLMNAMQRTAVSLVNCFSGEQKKVIYPELI